MKSSIFGFLAALAVFTSPVLAQDGAETAANDEAAIDYRAQFQIELGPMNGAMRKVAQVEVGEGYQFAGPQGAQLLLQAMGNMVDGGELGFLSPVDYFDNEAQSSQSWFLVFEFDEVGYIKDDDKDELDAAAMFESIKADEPANNEARQAAGLGTMHVQRFVIEPNYNDVTKNLEWALEFRTQPENALLVNHNIKILGRKGYMKVTLVCSPEQLEASLPYARRVLEGFSFQEGQTYAEFKKGDKIAEYGLTGLVVGGGLALAAKSGLLQKLMKPLIVGVLALGAFFKKLFGRGGSA